MLITINRLISSSNNIFKREIWDKFTEFTFLKWGRFQNDFDRNEGDFKISQNERDKYSPNFTNKHAIPGESQVTSSQRAHKGKNYLKNNPSILATLINITP